MPTPARIALITGASGGIGSAIARRFAAEGFRLALCGRNTEKLEAVRASLPQGTEALLLPGDVNDAGYQDACLAAVQARFGGLDVLVNCAGMAQSDAFEDITPARFDEIMTLNCRTPFFLCQKALPLLRQSQAASILNIASVTAPTRATCARPPMPRPSTPWPGLQRRWPRRSMNRASACI